MKEEKITVREIVHVCLWTLSMLAWCGALNAEAWGFTLLLTVPFLVLSYMVMDKPAKRHK